jgi:hypothetical protein
MNFETTLNVCGNSQKTNVRKDLGAGFSLPLFYHDGVGVGAGARASGGGSRGKGDVRVAGKS